MQNAGNSQLQISERGIALIKRWEGFRATPYYDAAGNLTIGFGHKIAKGQTESPLSLEKAEEMLRDDLTAAENTVREEVTLPLTQSQYDALVLLVFNIGARAFVESTLLRWLNAGRADKAANEWLRWDKVHGADGVREVQGLADRRAAERMLFLSV